MNSELLPIFSYGIFVNSLVNEYEKQAFNALPLEPWSMKSTDNRWKTVHGMERVKNYKSGIESVMYNINDELKIEKGCSAVGFNHDTVLLTSISSFLKRKGVLNNQASDKSVVSRKAIKTKGSFFSAFITLSYEKLKVVMTGADHGDCIFVNPKELLMNMILNERSDDMQNDLKFLSTMSRCMGMECVTDLWKHIEEMTDKHKGSIKLNKYNL